MHIKKQHITKHPEINELKQRIKECKDDLLALLEDWHYLQTVVQPRIMFVYETYFGDLENEIESKSDSAARLDRRVELLSIKVRRGESLTEKTISFVDRIVKHEFDKDKKTIPHSSFNGKPRYSYRYNSKAVDYEMEARELSSLYRNLVKLLHPDVAGETDNFIRYWDNVLQAYKSNDLHRIKLFYKTLCVEEKEYLDTEQEKEDLSREIQDLKLSVEVEKRKIERIKTEEPFSIEDKLNDASWITSRKRKLREQLFQIDKQIHYNQKLLKALTVNSVNVKDNLQRNEFQEEFASNTYYKSR